MKAQRSELFGATLIRMSAWKVSEKPLMEPKFGAMPLLPLRVEIERLLRSHRRGTDVEGAVKSDLNLEDCPFCERIWI